MLQIGSFSILSKIGIRTLRYYDNAGLLVPAYIDETTNYRYYSEEQLVIANRIEALRGMGMKLRQIKHILETYDSAESIKNILCDEICHKEAEISEGQAQLKLLQSAMEYFEDENYHYHCNITLKEFPEQRVLCYRSKVSTYEHESLLWKTLHNDVIKSNASLSHLPVNIAIYHDKEYKEKDIDIEVQIGITNILKENDTVTSFIRPPILAATVTMKGELSFYQELNSSISHWILQNGYEFNGPMFNRYHVAPKINQEPIVEVCYPVKLKK